MSRIALAFALGITCLVQSLLSPCASAQPTYPDRPIKLIVPFPPGGVYDAIARPLADRLKGPLGAVIIENVGGGGGIRGVTMAARATPDGYTFLLGGSSGFIVTPLASRRPLYDPVADFEPVARLAIVGLSFVAYPGVPAKDLASLIAYAKANPGKVSYGTPGAGTTNHFAGEMLKSLTDTPGIAHVPYAGAGPAMNDVVGGHIAMLVANVTGQVLEAHKAGQVRILAVTTTKRLEVAPEVPTAAEAGVPGLVAEVFAGIFAPKGTPASAIERVAKAVNETLADKDLRDVYRKAGFEADKTTGPEHLRSFLAAELKRWKPIIDASGFKLE